MSECLCATAPVAPFERFKPLGREGRWIGVDDSSWRYADVTIKTCTGCDTKWLHYFYEHEAYQSSSRFYLGIVTPEVADSLSPQEASGVLESLPWYIMGGGYFRGKVYKGSGSIRD